jgi:hypothetical protein
VFVDDILDENMDDRVLLVDGKLGMAFTKPEKEGVCMDERNSWMRNDMNSKPKGRWRSKAEERESETTTVEEDDEEDEEEEEEEEEQEKTEETTG